MFPLSFAIAIPVAPLLRAVECPRADRSDCASKDPQYYFRIRGRFDPGQCRGVVAPSGRCRAIVVREDSVRGTFQVVELPAVHAPPEYARRSASTSTTDIGISSIRISMDSRPLSRRRCTDDRICRAGSTARAHARQPQRIGDDDQGRQRHAHGRDQRRHETECRRRDGDGVVGDRPRQVLPDHAIVRRASCSAVAAARRDRRGSPHRPSAARAASPCRG